MSARQVCSVCGSQPELLLCVRSHGIRVAFCTECLIERWPDLAQQIFDYLYDKGLRPCERSCRVCGCTDSEACEGGCEWVEEDLCSRCAGRAAGAVLYGPDGEELVM